MKKVFTILCLILGLVTKAQYNNEWIDYNKTYFKFKVGSTGLYRIPQAVLQTVGIGTGPAENFQLWRNGEQVPLYTSVASGVFGAADYIEFYGIMNDGKQDTKLYRTPTLQLSDKWSLHTDTAAYFLTVNPGGGNLRLINENNDVASNSLPTEPYFMHSLELNYNTKINPGLAAVIGEYVYSSSYDIGEGWTSRDIYSTTPLVENLSNLFVSNSGPSVSFQIAASGNALNSRNVVVSVNGSQILSQPMNFFAGGQYNTSFSTSLIGTAFDSIKISNNTANTTDRMVVHKIKMTYPRAFNFGGATQFEFGLPATPVGNYLEISNFNNGGSVPVLIDLTNLKRYNGDITVPGIVRFALPASGTRNFVLLSSEASLIKSINNLQARNFINFSNSQNQSDYLIISNPRLYFGSSGNQVEAYRAYRSSVAGGGYNAKIYDIDQLVDQFAFGIKGHPYSVKNFLRFARAGFAQKPKFVFIIGKGITYDQFRKYEFRSSTESIDLVPTFGLPGSDNILASDDYDALPETPIGRLSVVLPQEVEIYLEKVKEHDLAIKSGSQTLKDRGWMKNIVHAIGGSDPYLQAVIYGYMNAAKDILEDTLFGGNVKSFSKNSAFSVQQLTSAELQNLFADGINILTYFGHSSANTLEFNLDDPSVYNNQGKYPMFIVNGCNAGNLFLYDTTRFSSSVLTLSEKYLLAKQRGSIGFIASTHYGIVNYLNIFVNSLYSSVAGNSYDKSIGEIQLSALTKLLQITGTADYYGRMHAEQISLHGDPAVFLYPHSKPDYVVEDPQIKINPGFVSVADATFEINAKIFNVGRAINDSILFLIQRQLPNGQITDIYREKIPAIRYADSIKITVPINPLTDKGENKIIVTIDPDNKVTELSETNNSITKSVVIIEDEIRPISPYNYSIVNTPNITFYASAANPLSGNKNYIIEVDTTESFNSLSKKSQTISTTGGLLEFNVPGFSMQDSTVYYWRTAPVASSGNSTIWNNASFVYLSKSTPGYNQSHFFQFQKNTFTGLTLDADRQTRYNTTAIPLRIQTGIYPVISNILLRVYINDVLTGAFGCKQNSLQFLVYDSVTIKALANTVQPDGFGKFGSYPPCVFDRNAFEFPYDDFNYRKKAMNFLDSLPDGYYVSVTNFGSPANTTFIEQWMADTAILGSGKSLYHSMKRLGLTEIDKFTNNKPFAFVFKKGSVGFPIYQFVENDVDDIIDKTVDLYGSKFFGKIESPWFGPAKKWNEFHWNGKFLGGIPDVVSVDILGKDFSGNETYITSISTAVDTTLSFINAQQYPYLKMRLQNKDSIHYSPNQLAFWRINGDLPPEGTIAPNIKLTAKDTLELGEPFNFELAFKNISATAFDSIKVNMIVTDRNNVPHILTVPNKKPLQSGDTTIISYSVDTKNYSGANTFYVNVNPDFAQPEQYLFNNFLFRNFYVKPDNYDPTLDVTFNGVRILNRDIVSSKPHIMVKLKDNNRFMELNDTSLMKVKVRLPSGELKTYRLDNDTLKFTPANTSSGGDNTATIDFNPAFLEDGEYELIVSGKDRSGNESGQLEYKVIFSIINKPMISNLLNYPNPFTTSTAFVFTVTGSEVPQNLRIQILTITGKVVREITKEELGPIHIGRNITEYKWDGTDQYGQKLANGVYLYRFITNLNGKSLEKYKQSGDNTDKYFNNGYGKMYLMR